MVKHTQTIAFIGVNDSYLKTLARDQAPSVMQIAGVVNTLKFYRIYLWK